MILPWRHRNISECRIGGDSTQYPGEGGAAGFADDQLMEHYRQTELTDTSSKTMRTKQVYEHQLANVVSPRWGRLTLQDVKPIAVETWLKGSQTITQTIEMKTPDEFVTTAASVQFFTPDGTPIASSG